MSGRHDVVVVGAGPAGACHALAAARAGASVLLVGPPARHRRHTVELLTAGAHDAVAGLGVVGLPARPCAGVLASWGGAVVDKPALRTPGGAGWIVDRTALDPALVAAAVSAGCTWVPAKAQGVERDGGAWRVRVGGEWRRADRVVLATGRTARLPRLGITREVTHRMTALTGWVDARLPGLGDRLHVTAAPGGWWYAIGCGAGTALGLCTDTDLLRTVDRFAWAGHRVDTWHRSATTARTTGPAPPGVAVIGDAALAADPLSGQGLALAVEGAVLAADDPTGYPDWLARATAAHAAGARAVYSAAGLDGPFWRRRAGGRPSVAGSA
ncbi:FAD-dependent oxidoreductase [Actinosynnema sp. NPDC050801]|uniref:NAD(P)/FAD-dependent oxidoreductase n=1 Tax=unclassified Actinosynnema TaxID=2637065 RepID=UPI0033F278E9